MMRQAKVVAAGAIGSLMITLIAVSAAPVSSAAPVPDAPPAFPTPPEGPRDFVEVPPEAIGLGETTNCPDLAEDLASARRTGQQLLACATFGPIDSAESAEAASDAVAKAADEGDIARTDAGSARASDDDPAQDEPHPFLWPEECLTNGTIISGVHQGGVRRPR